MRVLAYCRIVQELHSLLEQREQYPSHVGHKRPWAELFLTPGSRQAGILHLLLVKSTERSTDPVIQTELAQSRGNERVRR